MYNWIISEDSFFEEKHQLLNYVEPHIKKYYKRLLFKYNLYYKKANDIGKEEIKEKIENMMAKIIEEAKNKKEEKEQEEQRKKAQRAELVLQNFYQIFKNDNLRKKVSLYTRLQKYFGLFNVLFYFSFFGDLAFFIVSRMEFLSIVAVVCSGILFLSSVLLKQDLECFFEEKYNQIRYSNFKTKKNYKNLFYKYNRFYKETDKKGKKEIEQSIENILKTVIEDSNRKREEKVKWKQTSEKTLKKFQEEFENDQQHAPLLKIDG